MIDKQLKNATFSYFTVFRRQSENQFKKMLDKMYHV
jgi:hypothetical protein